MSMTSFPFDSRITGYDENNYPIYDRAVNSSTITASLSKLLTTGVISDTSNGFLVSAGEGMTVKVKPGNTVINGIIGMEPEERTLSVQAADYEYDRIDTVVLRLNTDIDVRAIDLYIIMGTPAASPVAPTLNREGSIYELGLANIYIPVNTVTIDNERITDTRGDITRCGYTTSAGYAGINNQVNVLTNSVSNCNQEISEIKGQVASNLTEAKNYAADLYTENNTAIKNITTNLDENVKLLQTGINTACVIQIKASDIGKPMTFSKTWALRAQPTINAHTGTFLSDVRMQIDTLNAITADNMIMNVLQYAQTNAFYGYSNANKSQMYYYVTFYCSLTPVSGMGDTYFRVYPVEYQYKNTVEVIS